MSKRSPQEDCFEMEKDPDLVECVSSLPVQIDSFLSEQAAADAARSAMVSAIGLDSDKVAALCNAANEEVSEDEKVQIANFLCPGSYTYRTHVKGMMAFQLLELRLQMQMKLSQVHIRVI
ncbi:unnamed protein product [Sphagnum compactum]